MSLFVTFEGPEGAGKSTQIRRLASELEARGYSVVATREPGGTAIGEAIRQILLAPEHSAMLPETEALLNTAARAQHVAEVIQPALAAGKIVLCDRFVDSTLVYQGAGRGLPTSDLLALQRFATRGLWPDLTLLLDLPVEVGQARRRASGEPLSRFDADALGFHERVRTGFLALARDDPARWRIIDAAQSEEAVAREVLAVVLERLPPAPGRQ
ncbi:dTMP kinase [Sphaerobacter thermophilus]|uniref:Thymidylate kinase n=1 Tax=Sphaerobacter thermophilus (strain ATCC 49802 / DSM 20745 / KCCM 41009 / NCIMB 13125 / S 6022) TaxID=479434 RepID=D1C2B8_SPHTD|nr:dTMP kinase [Sphaerobacter thermophilus]ACZ38385.1 thymidylate kinase [Sphaerobacter thermophilus DSM 20745]